MTFQHLDVSTTALYALHLLGKSGNMSRVAQDLGVTQSAISRMVTTLENKYGVPLVRRSARPLELTQEGCIVASLAEDLETKLSRLNSQMQRLRTFQDGSITIASFGTSSSTHFLPALVKDFQKLHPRISVSIQEYDHADQFAALTEEQADFGVLVNASNALETLPLGYDELLAIMRPDDPLAEKSRISPEDLMTRDFIMTRAGSAPLIKTWFRQAMLKPNVQHSIRQINSILGMINAGLGISILAHLGLPNNISPLMTRPLTPSVRREISLVKPQSNTSSLAAETFWNFISKRLEARVHDT
jgi:DNA-binding transcriptional LysR family regulator